jgi:ligand-binding sensor domain-containing protein
MVSCKDLFMSFRIIHKLIFILVFSSWQFLLPAQEKVMHFSHLTRENGLPSNRTRCVLQDFRGYVWIGTDNGLVRYDGRNFTVFSHDRNDPSSIIDICINALFETQDSLLLIGTIDGLSIYNPLTNNFTGYSVYHTGNKYFPAKNIHSFYEDSDRSIWIGTEDGLVHMNRTPWGFKWFPLSCSEIKTDRLHSFNFITKIIQDPGNNRRLLVSTLGGLLQIDKLSGKITRDYKKNINNGYDIIDISLDSGRYLWSCGWGKGLNCLDLQTGLWQEYPYNAQKPISIVGITNKSPDEFWLATIDHGLGVFNKTEHSFRFFQKIAGDDKSLLSNSVIRVNYMNDKNDLWIMSDIGINLLDQRYHSFRDIILPFGNNYISVFLMDSEKGHLYLGTIDGKGLFGWDEKMKAWNVFPPEEYPGKYGLSILRMYKDFRGVLWLGTRSGLLHLDPATRKLILFRTPDGKPLPLLESWIYAITEDQRSNLWIGTRNDGVVRIDSARTHITHYLHNPHDPSSLIDGGRFSSICADKFKNIWIASDNGVSIYDPAKDSFRNDLMDSLLKFGVSKRWTNGIVRDTLGRMWMVIDGEGLVRVEMPEKGYYRFKLFNTSNGLNDPTPGSMATDNKGGIWLINYGLLYINPYNETIHLFDEHNGLNRPLSFDESLYIDPDNNIYIGGRGKYETKNIGDLDFSPLTIKLLLESLEVNGKNFSTGEPADTVHPMILRADQNNLLFRYTGICFQEVEHILFRYKMEGYDKDWIMAGTGREARYTNLPPGRYRFVFQVSNRGIWLAQGSSTRFIIRPYFFKTWWFITLVIVVIGFILFMIYRYRVAELLRLERLRTRIATDLHDDVGSTLSSISILSDILSRQVENPQSARMVSTIGTNAHKMLEKIDDIIWVVNPSNDRFRNLGLRIREFAIPLFESKNIMHEICFDKHMNSLQLSMEVRRNIYLIAKEAINNAVKYAECRSVKINFSQEHPGVIMEICDDGKGFDPDAPTSRNGIKNMKVRASQINSEIEIRSATGKGTQILLLVSLK